MKKGYVLVFIVLMQLIAGIAVHAQTTTLFSFGSAWKFYAPAADPGTTWRTTTFDDNSWGVGTGHLGYGETWTTSCIPAGSACTSYPVSGPCGTVSCNKYPTAYFRKTITIADPTVYDSIRFSIFMDDGIVLYVNGNEVWRNNMPTSPGLNLMTYSINSAGQIPESTAVNVSIPISAFTAGTNVIAAEIHQVNATTSDCDFNVQALGVIRTNFFSLGSSWKYLANGSDQGTAWRASAFNDASWLSGTGFVGYGETWTTTCITAGATCTAPPSCNIGNGCAKYVTAYLRKSITIPDPTLFDSVRFSVFMDDGVVMYVNGTEVWRNNMPALPATILYNTLASGNIPESTAVIKSVPIAAFTAGVNVIAFEVHQNATTTSDMDFNASATGVIYVPPPPVTLVRGPYLQMGNQTAVSLRWRTNVASKSRLQVGTVYGTYPITVSDAAALTDHELRVTGLTGNTKYYYRFGTDTSFVQGDTSNFFVTAPADTTTRHITMAAFGDCGINTNSFQSGSLSAYRTFLAANNMKAADLMMLIGDNAYNAGTDAEFQTGFFGAYSSTILKNHILFPAPGNHDYANDATRQVDHNIPYYTMFSLPAAGECGGVASGTEAYYSYDWGNVHVLSLDSYGEENAGTTRLYDTLGAQVNWIKNDLAANNKKWVVVYFHHPPYTMGSHTSDGESELVNIRQNFIRILERYGVDLVICGHSHDYERSYLLKGHYGNEASFNKAAHTTDSSSAKYDGTTNSCPYTYPSGKINHGTVYVVSGSSGADGGVQAGYPHNALPFSIDDGGMFFLDFQNNRLDAKFIRRDNTIADKFTIVKDTKKADTVSVLYGESVTLNASWPGTYAWPTGATTKLASITVPADSMVTVKDNSTNTCLIDRHYVDLQCTMPNITVSPSDITRDGCHASVSYVISDTGRPNPALTYTFSGATTAAGSGTGSGTTFNTGVTTVTITATNECGSSSRNFNITIQPLPVAYNVTGSGGYCAGSAGRVVGLDNSQTGVNYQLYSGASAVGTAVTGTGSAISFGTYAAAVYSVLATDNTTGCTAAMAGNATLSVQSLPNAYTVTGGGNYCPGGAGAVIGLSNSEAGVNYQLYDGTSPVGSIVAGVTGSAISFGSFTTVSTYSVVATNAVTTCTSNMTGSVAVGLHPLPAVYNMTGGGNYCAGGTGSSVGLDNSATGINYKLYAGSSLAATVAGTGSSFSFGSFTSIATYTATATDAITGCSAAMSGSLSIATNPRPIIQNINGGGNFCPGGTGVPVGLSNSQTGINYRLYRGTAVVGSIVAGTGTGISFGLQNITGSYSVAATNATTGCASGMSGIVAVNTYAPAIAYSVTGTGNYCQGGSGRQVGLSNSQAGMNYTLYNGAIPVSSVLAGTGAALSFGSYTNAATYTVAATELATGCITAMTGNATVGVNPLPILHNVTGGGSFCSGEAGMPVGLDLTETGINYRLYNGAVAGSTMPGNGAAISYGAITASGYYTVLAINAVTGCTEAMNGVAVVTQNALPMPYSVAGTGNYCAGGAGLEVTLPASQTDVSYQLNLGTSTIGAVVAGTGAAISFGWQTTAGGYSVSAVNTVTGCTNTMAGMATIGINELPAIYLVMGGGSYCAGGAGVHIGLGGSASGIAYQLYNGSTASGIALSGTDVPLDFGSITAAGTYSVRATNTATGCVNNMSGTQDVVVTPLVTPAVSILQSPAGNVCAGTTVIYNSSVVNGGSSPAYEWSVNGSVVASGVSSYSFVPTNGNTVSVKLTSNIACVTAAMATNSVSMTVKPMVMPYASIAAYPGNILCDGSPVTFVATPVNGGTAPVYAWLKNSVVVGAASTYEYTPTDGDLLTLSMASSAPCALAATVFSNSIKMDVNERYVPVVEISADPGVHIMAGQKVKIKVMVTGAGPTPDFSWAVNGVVVPGATSTTFTSTQLADKDSVSFSVNGTEPCGLGSYNSLTMHVTTGIDGISAADGNISVVPNPTTGSFTIEGVTGLATDDVVNISVANVLGQVVYTASPVAHAGRINEQVILSNTIADGMYLLNVQTALGNRVFHLVLKK